MRKEKITVCTIHSDRYKINYYSDFEIIDELPELETEAVNAIRSGAAEAENRNYAIAIKRVEIDCEQGRDDAFDYYYYNVKFFDGRYWNEHDEDERKNFYDGEDTFLERYAVKKAFDE